MLCLIVAIQWVRRTFCVCVRISLCVNREGVCLLVSVRMCNCTCVCDREFAYTDVCTCEYVQCASACVCDREFA